MIFIKMMAIIGKNLPCPVRADFMYISVYIHIYTCLSFLITLWYTYTFIYIFHILYRSLFEGVFVWWDDTHGVWSDVPGVSRILPV